MPARLTHEQATAVVRPKGYEPLEPYPGAKTRWRCLHVRCGREVGALLDKIKQGTGSCVPCGVEASAAGRQVDVEEAREVMLARLLEPLDPYPGGNHRKWRCRCLQCGAICYPTRGNVWRGQGGCVPCGVRRNALGRLGDAGQAALEMLAAFLEPLDEYPGTNHPWRSRHLLCGREIRPRLMHIRAGRVGCLECGFASMRAKQLGDPVQAAADMREAGYDPLEDYPGAAHPWRCIHQPCGRTVRPRLHHIRSGQGGCSNCATHGFNTAAPAVLYVLHHPDHGAVKVGITGSDSDRIERFGRRGWACIRVWEFTTGREARGIEQAVHNHLRDQLGLTAHLDSSDMGAVGGWTETYDAGLVSALELVELVAAELVREAVLETG
ncbi:hypothetical protein ACFXDJ_06930 [Streptomyces sp. NPDC059443]|uniref:hypothetical protein n=1 Tax=unclassified Streptomyces TaxID=2593676 RepID=UPI0036A1563F